MLLGPAKVYPRREPLYVKPLYMARYTSLYISQTIIREGCVNLVRHGARRPLLGSAGPGGRHGGVTGRGQH